MPRKLTVATDATAQIHSSSVDMPKTIPTLFLSAVVTLAAGAQIAFAGDNIGLTMLEHLRQRLDAAHALPKGSRPSPPDIRLSGLYGVARADVERILGAPTYCGEQQPFPESKDCRSHSLWAYSWGPPPPETHSGPGWVQVITGGPWLLLLRFSSDRITAVAWQGQK
jgi:hypothetical protein